MPFPQTITDAAQIPDWAREYYVQDGAQWCLNVQTVPMGEDVSGLKSALEKERQLRRDAEKSATEYQLRYKDIDPQKVREMQDRLDALKDKQIYDTNGLDALKAEWTETIRKASSQREQDLAQQLEASRAGIAQMQERMKRQKIETVLQKQILDAGIAPYAVPDALHRLSGIFNDIDGDTPIARKDTGDILYGSDAVRPYSPTEHLSKLKAEAPHLWPLSAGAGNGTPGAGQQSYRISVTDARDNTKWQAASQAAQKAGVPLEVVPA